MIEEVEGRRRQVWGRRHSLGSCAPAEMAGLHLSDRARIHNRRRFLRLSQPLDQLRCGFVGPVDTISHRCGGNAEVPP